MTTPNDRPIDALKKATEKAKEVNDASANVGKLVRDSKEPIVGSDK